MPEPSSSSTETSATFENRGTTTASARDAPRGGQAAQRTSSPTRPPSQSEPEATWSQSSATARPRGAVCAAWPAAPGITSDGGRGREAPPAARISAIERCSRSGRSTQIATPAATQKSAKQISRST